MNKLFSKYSEMLAERLNLGRRIKEDEARYTFFCAAILGGNYKHTDISLERPHDDLGGRKEIDAHFEPAAGAPACIFEFKFNQVLGSKQNSPRTQHAGSVFNDLCRLALPKFPRETRRFFVYVADQEMDGYFSNVGNNLTDFYLGEDLDRRFSVRNEFWLNRPQTFLRSIEVSRVNFDTRIAHVSELPGGFKLKIFEVYTVDS